LIKLFSQADRSKIAKVLSDLGWQARSSLGESYEVKIDCEFYCVRYPYIHIKIMPRSKGRQ